MTLASLDPRPEAAAPRFLPGSLAFSALAIGMLYEAVSAADRPVTAVVWGASALAAYAAALLCLFSRGIGVRRMLADWKFGAWIIVWYGVTYGLATTTWSPQSAVLGQVAISSVLRALWLVAVGLTCWAVGYAVGPGQPLRHAALRGVNALGGALGVTSRSRFTPWALYLVGTLARGLEILTTGRFGFLGNVSVAVSAASSYGQFISVLTLFAPLGVSIAAMQVYLEHRPGSRVSLALLFPLEIVFAGISGTKESFIVAVLAVAIPMSAARRRIPRGVVLVSVLVFLVVLIPFNQAYRSTVRPGPTTLSVSQAVNTAPAILQQTLTSSDFFTVLSNSTAYLFQRIGQINSPAIIVQRTPGQIPFGSPVQLAEAPVADMVPRALWAGKPILATGYQFSQQYFGLPATLYTSSAITPVGDLYRHGGWVPVMAGMFLLGCGVRLLDDVLDVRENPHAIFLVLLLFPSLVAAEQDWITLVASLPATFVVWLAAVGVAFRRRATA